MSSNSTDFCAQVCVTWLRRQRGRLPVCVREGSSVSHLVRSQSDAATPCVLL